MLSIKELVELQKAYLLYPNNQENVEAAYFLKQDVIDLLESIKNDGNVPYVKVFLVRPTEIIDGAQRVSMAMSGSNQAREKTGEGILANAPCPPYCGHEYTSKEVVPT